MTTATLAPPIPLRLELSPETGNVGVEYLYPDGETEVEWIGHVSDPDTDDAVPMSLVREWDQLWHDWRRGR